MTVRQGAVAKIISPRCRIAALSRVMGLAAHDAAPEPITEDAMKFMLLIYRDETAMQAASKAQIEQVTGAYLAYTEALKKADVLAGGDRLQPSSAATTVRVADGKSKVLDGPYAEAKEQLGGYYLIDVPDLDVALSWAARCPGASHGTIEVRPLWVM